MRLFAGAREQVGAESIEVAIKMPSTVLELKQAMSSQFKSLQSYIEFGRIAVDNEFLHDTDLIHKILSHPAIALIPPVSGG